MQKTGSVRQNIWGFVLFFEDYPFFEILIFYSNYFPSHISLFL